MRRQVCGEHNADFSSNESSLEVERPSAQGNRTPWLRGQPGHRGDLIARLGVDWIDLFVPIIQKRNQRSEDYVIKTIVCSN